MRPSAGGRVRTARTHRTSLSRSLDNRSRSRHSALVVRQLLLSTYAWCSPSGYTPEGKKASIGSEGGSVCTGSFPPAPQDQAPKRAAQPTKWARQAGLSCEQGRRLHDQGSKGVRAIG